MDTPAFLTTGDKAHMPTVQSFLSTIFRGWDWRSKGGCIGLRGIGEAGTAQDGKFRDNKFIDPRNAFGFSQIETHLNRWAENSIASFVLPGILHEKAAEIGHATEDMVRAFCAIMLDIDSGNVAEKLDHCRDWIGEPTMIVNSGGITELGHSKVHAYWSLTEPSERVLEIGRIRKILAAKVGGDQSFGRAAQVIRIAGSIYGKGGIVKPVTIVSHNTQAYDIGELIDAIESMEWMEGCFPTGVLPLPEWNGGAMNFAAGAGMDLNKAVSAMTTDVHEGGINGTTRWDSFNAVAGHYIHCIRNGSETPDSAKEKAWGWALAHMKPTWERHRFDTEWAGLLNHDIHLKGMLPLQAKPIVMPEGIEGAKIEPLRTEQDLLSWAVNKRSSLNPPARIDLVDGLISAGLRHLIVAEGGAGKTFLMMDLMLKLAASYEGGPVHKWLGQPINPAAYGGTYVMFTAEDNQDSLDRRWQRIDPDMRLREAAGDRLLVIPMDNVGGSFPLLSKRPGSADFEPSEQWRTIVQALVNLAGQGRNLQLVSIDTMNSTIHGDENSAEVIAQYMRALAPITGNLGAAILLSHHVRKLKDDKPVDGAERMLEAIRGSAAIKDNVRVAIGIWHAPDYKEQLDLMGIPIARKRLYQAAVVKSNEPMMDEERYLLRQPSGVLEDCSRAVQNAQKTSDMRQAWLIFCIGHYADQGFYMTHTGTRNGVHAQRNRLHDCLESLSRSTLQDMIAKLLKGRGAALSQVIVTGKTKDAQWLDVRGRHSGERLWIENEEEIKEPDWGAYEYHSFTGKIVPK